MSKSKEDGHSIYDEAGDWQMWWIETDTSMTSREARSQDEARDIYESEHPSKKGTVRMVCNFWDHRKQRVYY